MSTIERASAYRALAPRARYLPEVIDTGFVIGEREPLAVALHRMTTAQFALAIGALADPAADLNIATRVSLDALARITAVLRLVRSTIGDEAYRTELRVLKGAIETLQGIRGGERELRALDQIRARYQGVLQPDALTSARGRLLRDQQLQRLQALADRDKLQETLVALRRAQARFAAWPVDDVAHARMYGRAPLGDSFDSLEAGLGRTYRRGRRRWKSLHDDIEGASRDEVTAQLRHEARHLGHQLVVISTTWPELFGATANACARLDSALGELSGLHLLGAWLAEQAIEPAEASEIEVLTALLDQGKRELCEVVIALGALVYAERSGAFIERTRAYWQLRELTL